ncbi:DoxX family protein [[Mycobacterium] nativiensis]|uniref:DoxX family protein n=1 Tax=[Mycobacterium] nativiensis TaxID=2855503 RepID=A0ABU5XTK7_9MYCO|nr:DoxX family protein [Mycolicibacter sp. MYC340]MEB3031273.1 DoxX family protein [Mycolicibacter sp. MYC340]
MDIVILIGRILFAVVFIGGALGHFTQTDAMAAFTESKGIKPGKLAVLGSGAWMLAGATLVILGAWADLGALMLAVFLLPTAFVMHGYWREQDPQAKAAEQLHFSKDISLAGAALALFGFFVTAGGATGLQLTGPLFASLAG